jgi:GntR family transcriptional repressor for pyruvate dehydrogenase complex
MQVTTSRAATLADEIVASIVGGEFPSGKRIGTKDQLRRRYDVAYGTLNEALRILQQRGYVTSQTGPRGGLFATIPSPSDRLRNLLAVFPEGGSLGDCAEVRHALELSVVDDATHARTQRDVADLRRILRRMEAAAGIDDQRYLHENWRLHRRIADCCKNRVLASLYTTLLDANEPGPNFAIPDRHREASADENVIAHKELVEAIASGSGERAKAAVVAHEAFFAPKRATAVSRRRRRTRP